MAGSQVGYPVHHAPGAWPPGWSLDPGNVSAMTAQPDDDLSSYEVIHLGGEAAAIVPLSELRRLQAVQRHASAELLEDAEVEATLAAHRDWVAAGRPGAVSHEVAMAELLGWLVRVSPQCAQHLEGTVDGAGLVFSHDRSDSGGQPDNGVRAVSPGSEAGSGRILSGLAGPPGTEYPRAVWVAEVHV